MKSKRKNLWDYIIFLIFIILVVIIIKNNIFIDIAYLMNDWTYGWNIKNNSVVVVEIDDATLKHYSWPLNRSLYAKIVEFYPKCVGFDIGFFKTSPDDEFLNLAFENAKIKCTIATQYDFQSKSTFKTSRSLNYCNNGYTNVVLDTNNIARFFKPKTRSFKHFAIKMMENCNISNNYKKNIEFINYPYFKDFKRVSFMDVLNNSKRDELTKLMKNKIVLIGTTAARLKDFFNTPIMVNMPGVYVLASIILANINNKILNYNEWLIMIYTLLVLSILFFFRKRSSLFIYFGMGFLILTFVVSFALYYKNVVFYIFYPITTIMLFEIVYLIRHYYKLHQEKKFISNLFSNYVSKELLNHILNDYKNINLEGNKRYVVVMFLDIRNFTRFSETKNPKVVFEFLNEILSEASEIIIENKGFINKFLGDGLMALWNVPLKQKNPEMLAVKSALKILENAKKHNIEIGIGIHAGVAMVGNIGSKSKKEYTAIGDVVNTASRLEGLNKYFNSNIILSENVYKKISQKMKQKFIKIGKIKVKGKSEFIIVYGFGKNLKKRLRELNKKTFSFDTKF